MALTLEEIEHRAMPLEVGGALRLRLEAEGRRQKSEVRDQTSEVRGEADL